MQDIEREALAPRAPAGSLRDEPAIAAPPETVIEPAAGWQFVNVRELWRFRELLLVLSWRDIKVRYAQTLLGATWAILQPTIAMVLFSTFLGRVTQPSASDIPYPLFVYSGLLVWVFFSTSVTSAAASIVSSEQLITKVYFPRLLIPLASVGVALADFGMAITVLVGLMVWYGVWPGGTLVWAPLALLVAVLMAVGVGSLLAALNVRYRDFRYLLPTLIQFWLLATPAIYLNTPATAPDAASEEVPASMMQTALDLNPLNGIVSAFRASLLDREMPWRALGLSTVGATVCLVVGCLVFRRMETSFADTI